MELPRNVEVHAAETEPRAVGDRPFRGKGKLIGRSTGTAEELAERDERVQETGASGRDDSHATGIKFEAVCASRHRLGSRRARDALTAEQRWVIGEQTPRNGRGSVERGSRLRRAFGKRKRIACVTA
ncbi:MAG TPA: hypothetical protein VGA77_08480, partial [Propylenella sp.]